MFALQLARHQRPVWLWLLAPARLYACRPIKPRLQIGVADLCGYRPGKTRTLEADHHVPHRRTRNAHHTGDFAHRDTAFPVQSQYLAHIAHLRPPRRHPFLPAQMQPQGWPNDQAPHPPAGGRELIGMPAGITSEHRPGSNRNGGRDDLGIRRQPPVSTGTSVGASQRPLLFLANSTENGVRMPSALPTVTAASSVRLR